MAANCGNCGAKRNALIHSRGECQYVDASKAGLSPIGKAREAYLRSDTHRQAYREAETAEKCLAGLAGAPGACLGPLTPHHIAGRGAFGGQRAAEQYPVIALCSYHNEAIESDVQMARWAERNTFERDGKVYPFRMRQKSRRTEAALHIGEGE